MAEYPDYPWASYSWADLHRALARPNRYRYGLLVPGHPSQKPRAIAHHRTPGTRLFRVPEGWLILSRYPEVQALQLQDLSQHPIRTGPYLLTWGAMKHDRSQRARLMVSPRWVREKARYVAWVTQGLTWPAGKPKAPRQVLKAVNAVTREILHASKYALLPWDTARRWNKLVRKNLWRFFTGTLRLGRKEVKALLQGLVLLGKDWKGQKGGIADVGPLEQSDGGHDRPG